MDEQSTAAFTTAEAGHAERPGRMANRALWAAQALIALIFLAVSYPKITLDPTAVDGFAEMGFNTAGTLIIGCLEIVGAIGLLIPRLSGLAALGVLALMIGATIATTLTTGVAPALLPAALGVLAAVIARGRWYQTVELARAARSLVRR